jgi:hypothetical protein
MPTMKPQDETAPTSFGAAPFNALDDLPDEQTFTLRSPVTLAGVTTSSVRLAEPTAGQYETIAGMVGMESYFYLIFLTSGLPLGAAEQLGSRDYNDLRDFLDQYAPAVTAMPDAEALPTPMTLTLRKPVRADEASEPITSLILREPTAGERRKVEAFGGTKASIELIALVSGAPRAAIARISARDQRKAAIYLMGFINGGRRTGAAV